MRNLISGFVGAAAFLFAASASSQSAAQSLAITDVTVVDATGAPAQPRMTVVVAGGRIANIVKFGTVALPAGAKVVDGAGKFLIPGLWDMHVHLFNNASRPGTNNSENYFPLMIATGVTTVRDMWTDPDDLVLVRSWARKRDSGELLAPRVLPGSSIVDGSPGFWPNVLSVKSAEEARAAVRMLKGAGAGFIKVYWNLSADSYRAIAAEAKAQAIEFSGHVPFAISAFEATNTGQKSIEHMTGVVETCSSKEEELRAKPYSPAVGRELRDTYDPAKCRRLFQLYAKNRTWQVPTVVLHRGLTFGDDPALRGDSRYRYVSASTVAGWIKPPDKPRATDIKARAERFRDLLDAVGTMHKEGVPILAGTDVGNAFVIPGFSLHDELALLVAAGLTPMQALQAATRDAAVYADRLQTLGTVEAGKIADLVLLNADPFKDIRNTAAIEAVVVNGRLVTAEERKAMLAGVERRARVE